MIGMAEDRFWAKVENAGCWLWTGSRSGHGYGQFWVDGRTVPAHRVAYEALVGPIPDDLEPDHLCPNRNCVNPSHIALVSHRANTLRGQAPTALNARKTHCPRGHAYDEANTYWQRHDGGIHRRCLTCHRQGMRDRRAFLATRSDVTAGGGE